MTAVECLHAVKFALWHVFTLPGLTWSQRIQLALLKFVAVVGYHHGRIKALQDPLLAAQPPQEQQSFATSPPKAPKDGYALDCTNYIAVVIPVYARTEHDLVLLVRVLQHLSQQQRSANLTVLVSDGSPLEIPSFLCQGSTFLISLPSNSGPAVARNCGIAKAKQHGASIICFCDADCQPAPDWLATMENAQQQTPGIVCGMTLSHAPHTAIGHYHEVFGTLNGRMLRDGSVLYGCTCNLSISVADVGLLFDISFPTAAFEDVEFCIRAKKQGITLTYNPKAVVRHHYGAGLMALYQQFQRYGRYERLAALRHEEYLPWLHASSEISCLTNSSSALFLRF